MVKSKSVVDKTDLITILSVIFIVLIVILVCVLLYFNIKKPAKPKPPPPPPKCTCELCYSSKSVNTYGIDNENLNDPIKNWTLYEKKGEMNTSRYVGLDINTVPSSYEHINNVPDSDYPDIKLYEYNNLILKINNNVNANFKDAIIDFNKNILTIPEGEINENGNTVWIPIEIKIEDIGYDESRELLLLTFSDEDVKKYRKPYDLYQLYISKYILISKNLLC